MPRQVLPWKVTINPANVTENQSVTVTVELTGVTPTAQDVTISGTAGFWSGLPSTVTVPANGSTVTFNSTVASGSGPAGGITAQCNGGTASGSVMNGSGK
ncbi:MAG: hypothetical protein ABL949_12260 [Fimbriimonadaceae bacterium]